MFLLDRMDEKAIEEIKKTISFLSEPEKRLLRLYLQLPAEDLLKKAQQFSNLLDSTENTKRVKEFMRQSELYQIAFLMKEKNIPFRGGKRKTLRQKKRRQTRKAKSTRFLQPK